MVDRSPRTARADLEWLPARTREVLPAMALAVVNSSLRRRERFVPYLFILPALIGLLTFEISPFFEAFSETLNPPNAITGITHFVGLGEYRVLFSDPNFTHSILVTLLFAALVNPIQVAISLLLALAVLKKGVRSSIFRVLYFLPVGSSLTVASVIWGVILSPNGGLANGLLTAAHLPSQQFFSSPRSPVVDNPTCLMEWLRLLDGLFPSWAERDRPFAL